MKTYKIKPLVSGIFDVRGRGLPFRLCPCTWWLKTQIKRILCEAKAKKKAMATSSKPQVKSTCDIFRNMSVRATRSCSWVVCMEKMGRLGLTWNLDVTNQTTWWRNHVDLSTMKSQIFILLMVELIFRIGHKFFLGLNLRWSQFFVAKSTTSWLKINLGWSNPYFYQVGMPKSSKIMVESQTSPSRIPQVMLNPLHVFWVFKCQNHVLLFNFLLDSTTPKA